MNERMSFVMRLQAGERMTDLCREFGISRKTGHKIWKRFQEEGPEGLYDRSRAPERRPKKIPEEVVELVVELRRSHPTWGAMKLKDVLERAHPGVKFPAKSTIALLLKRHGLAKPRRRARPLTRYVGPLAQAKGANDVWCVDFKGQFRMRNGQYCYPLTITDQYSRYIIACVGLESIDGQAVRKIFEEAFRKYGLPRRIRSDNGAPFASRALLGLSELSVFWAKLGIVHERIEPGHPEQNGRHERMHLTLKQETTRPAKANLLQQQERFDEWVEEFNHERPHEALGNKRPAEVYRCSERQLVELEPTPQYPLHDRVLRVSPDGYLRIDGKRFFVTRVLSNEWVGLRELDEHRWLVTFADLDLGVADARTGRLEVPEQLSADRSHPAAEA